MKRYIKATLNDDTLSYREKDNLAEEIFKVVKRYLTEYRGVSPRPSVSYSEYDILGYTFRINDQYRNSTTEYGYSLDSWFDVNEFRKAVRAVLKGHGFSKCKFDWYTSKMETRYITGPVIDRRKILSAIYFDI